ncbi:MAG: tryptophan 7-halogenase [Pseudomonadales bacterium]|jgi:tryptophan halogenase|nr:tryptophan 7-halogenase [Pseudomonadales bacterium]
MKKIIVLGGGSAGWLTSLLTREFYPEFDITLIESDEIGILGAGEGTVPHFIEVLDFLRIPVSALVRECGATLKIGIKFTHWNGDGTSYFHDFRAKDELEEWAFDDAFRYNMLSSYLVGEGVHLDTVNFYAKLAEQWKVPFVLNDLNDHTLTNYRDAIMAVQHLGNFALHFDARLLAKFLSQVAQSSRRIRRVEGKFSEASTDSSGNIRGIRLENGKYVDCDFIFDCSGFARLLLGKHFNERWIDYKRHLPLDTALPFFTPHDGGNIPPYTEAIALKYGWMWRIPVQERYGCGYVFDSSYINEEQAKAEVEALLGHPITSAKTFRFQAGAFENTLVKNCYGVGLSQHFVEPLEATSIWTFSKNLINFLKSGTIMHLTPELTAYINERCRAIIEPIPEFLYLHYCTRRNDSPFWQEFSSKTTMMDSLRHKQQLWQQVPLFDADTLPLQMFTAPSWLSVANGVHFFDRQSFKNLSRHWSQLQLAQKQAFLVSKQEHLARACLLHGDFLALMKQKSQPIP